MHPPDHYILSTGGSDVHRLRLLHEVYGPGTEALLYRVGLCKARRVVEIGCGTGNIACWMAEQLAPHGSVVGIDVSAAQIAEARREAERRNLQNIEFHVADAYAPGLPEAEFDIVYCRLVLMHLTDPAEALRAMRALARPSGRIVCEEMDLDCWLCNPAAPAMQRFIELNLALGDKRGENFRLGAALHRLFREVGFPQPEVGANFAVALQGERKRLLGLTFAEFAPELVELQLASPEEVQQVTADLLRLADDATTLFGFPLVAQVWATR